MNNIAICAMCCLVEVQKNVGYIDLALLINRAGGSRHLIFSSSPMKLKIQFSFNQHKIYRQRDIVGYQQILVPLHYITVPFSKFKMLVTDRPHHEIMMA